MPIVIFMAAVAIAYIERTSIAHLIPYIRKDLAYDSAALGYVLSAFGWGYVVALPVSGFIITRFGHRRVLAAGAIAWVVAAAGFACATNLYELVVARFALGVAEAPLFPLFVSWIAITSGRNSTSAKIGVVEGMSYLGMAFSGPLTVFAANNMGWRAAYAGVGLLALVVAAAALFLPNKSEPHASKSHSVTEPDDNSPFRLPLISFAACALGFLLYNFCKAFHSTWLPTILVESYGYTSASAASVTFIQSILAPGASVLSGLISAALLAQGLNLATARLLPMTLGFGMGSLLAAIPLVPSVVAPLVISSFVGVISTSALIWSVPGDISSRAARIAHVSGYLNAIANLGTIVSPLAVGYLLIQPSGHANALILVGVASVCAIVSFLVGYSVLAREISRAKRQLVWRSGPAW